MTFRRHAIYYAPRAGEFADFAASWLGWDPVLGREVPHPDLPLDVAAITATPRKYGFHGTIKAPFVALPGLEDGIAALAARLAPVDLGALRLHRIGGFLALVPEVNPEPLAAEVVRALDMFRAPMTPEDRARRKPEKLSERQRELLDAWGYPYVMEEFRFHLTLTGNDAPPEVERVLEPVLARVQPDPFVIEDLCLFGEAEDGRFHLVHRYALTG